MSEMDGTSGDGVNERTTTVRCGCGRPSVADGAQVRIWGPEILVDGRWLSEPVGVRWQDCYAPGDQAAYRLHTDIVDRDDEAVHNEATIRAAGKAGGMGADIDARTEMPSRDRYGCICGGCSPGSVDCDGEA